MKPFIRKIFPVGQGGLAFESIGNVSIIFDCGTKKMKNGLFQKGIDTIAKLTPEVNYLIISHFDSDHVNGISILLNSGIPVEKAIVPFIEDRYKLVFNEETNGAYQQIMDMLDQHFVQVVGDMKDQSEKLLWEWLPLSLLSGSDWEKLDLELSANGFELNMLSNPNYISEYRKGINASVKKVFGENGPNSKGLILLSQRCSRTIVNRNELSIGLKNVNDFQKDETGCLYIGDAKIEGNQAIISHLSEYSNSEYLLLSQIPHHGSYKNSNAKMLNQIKARYYFCCDKSEDRIQKNELYGSLKDEDKLLMVDTNESSLISNKIQLRHETES